MSRTLSGLISGDSDLDVKVSLAEVPASILTSGTLDADRLPTIPTTKVGFANQDIDLGTGSLTLSGLSGFQQASDIAINNHLDLGNNLDVNNCRTLNASTVNASTLNADNLTTTQSTLVLECDIGVAAGQTRQIDLGRQTTDANNDPVDGGELICDNIQCDALSVGSTTFSSLSTSITSLSTRVTAAHDAHAGYEITSGHDDYELWVPSSSFASTVEGNELIHSRFSGAVKFTSVVNGGTAGFLHGQYLHQKGMVATFRIPENYYVAKLGVVKQDAVTSSPSYLACNINRVGYHHGNHSTNFQFVEGVAGVLSNTGIIAPVADTNDEYVFVDAHPTSGTFTEPTAAAHETAHRVLSAGEYYNVFVGGAINTSATFASFPNDTFIYGASITLRRVTGT